VGAESASADLVISGDGTVQGLVVRHLDASPMLAGAVRTAGARVVVLAIEYDEAPFFERMQRAVDAAERELEPHVRPLFIASTFLADIVETNAFELRRGEPAPFVRIVGRRGPFLGFVALGEGGLAFFRFDGAHAGRSPQLVDVVDALLFTLENEPVATEATDLGFDVLVSLGVDGIGERLDRAFDVLAHDASPLPLANFAQSLVVTSFAKGASNAPSAHQRAFLESLVAASMLWEGPPSRGLQRKLAASGLPSTREELASWLAALR
jgi:hypothetical protein